MQPSLLWLLLWLHLVSERARQFGADLRPRRIHLSCERPQTPVEERQEDSQWARQAENHLGKKEGAAIKGKFRKEKKKGKRKKKKRKKEKGKRKKKKKKKKERGKEPQRSSAHVGFLHCDGLAPYLDPWAPLRAPLRLWGWETGNHQVLSAPLLSGVTSERSAIQRRDPTKLSN